MQRHFGRLFISRANPPELRRHYRGERRALNEVSQVEHAEVVARAVVNAGVLLPVRTCGAYLAHHPDGELDTLPLLSRLWTMSKTVGCPVIGSSPVGKGADMDLYRISPRTRLVPNRYGMLEPATRGRRAGRYLNPLSLSVLFMPLVAFDDEGTRLGMGAGYYDRYIGRLSHTLRPLLVGLAHEVQRTDQALPRNPWDVPLDAVVTEAGWQGFSSRAKV